MCLYIAHRVSLLCDDGWVEGEEQWYLVIKQRQLVLPRFRSLERCGSLCRPPAKMVREGRTQVQVFKTQCSCQLPFSTGTAFSAQSRDNSRAKSGFL